MLHQVHQKLSSAGFYDIIRKDSLAQMAKPRTASPSMKHADIASSSKLLEWHLPGGSRYPSAKLALTGLNLFEEVKMSHQSFRMGKAAWNYTPSLIGVGFNVCAHLPRAIQSRKSSETSLIVPAFHFFHTQAKVSIFSWLSWYMGEYSSTHRDLLSLICPLFPEPLRFRVQRLSSSCMTNAARYWEKAWQQRSCNIEKLNMKTAPWYLLWGVGCVVNHMTCRLWILLHISSQTVISDLYPKARIRVQPNLHAMTGLHKHGVMCTA